MEKKKVMFVCQFPPPIHGLSKAVEMLYNSPLSEKYDFDKIDITSNSKIVANLIKLIRSDSDIYYFTISQTKGGNVRDLLLLDAILRKKAKTVIHLHGGYFRFLIEKECNGIQRKLNYSLFKKVNRAVVLSESLKSIFTGIVSEERICVIPNCVDEEYVPEQLNCSNRTIEYDMNRRVLFLSNMIETKGYREVLDMALMEKRRVEKNGRKKMHFDFAGAFFEEKEKCYFEEFVSKNELSDYVTYHGIVSGEKKEKLLMESHFFVLPTRYPKEGQPISIIEAMINGNVIISTDNAAISDMMNTNINLNMNMESFDTNSAYLFALEMDSEEWKKVSIENHTFARNNFSYSKYISNFEQLFESI